MDGRVPLQLMPARISTTCTRSTVATTQAVERPSVALKMLQELALTHAFRINAEIEPVQAWQAIGNGAVHQIVHVLRPNGFAHFRLVLGREGIVSRSKPACVVAISCVPAASVKSPTCDAHTDAAHIQITQMCQSTAIIRWKHTCPAALGCLRTQRAGWQMYRSALREQSNRNHLCVRLQKAACWPTHPSTHKVTCAPCSSC